MPNIGGIDPTESPIIMSSEIEYHPNPNMNPTDDDTIHHHEPFKSPLDAPDFAVISVYFLMVLGTGIFSMFRSNRGTVSGYFLAGRFMSWLPVGASVFASNIGSEHFIGLAGAGAATGIGVGAFELNALLILQMTGWIFLPVFIASRVCTLPEYMSKRFGGQRIRIYLSVLSLFLYIFTKVSVNLYSGALFIQQSLDWNLYGSVMILLLLTAICTVTGGLAAVIYTDTLQCLVMIVGAGIVAITAFAEVGGINGLRGKYLDAIPSIIPEGKNSCAIPTETSFRMLRDIDDKDIPWLGFLLGQTPASIWYWCTDQMMVQRLLAAKSLAHAQGGTLFAGYLKISTLFFIIMPGMISRVLFPDEVACVDEAECFKYCQNHKSCSNTAYPKLVLTLMPTGLKGLMLAVMMAALMSDLTSIFNSASTLFTCDIWPLIRKNSSVRELMIVGRSFVLVMVAFSIAWIPVIEELQGGLLFIYIQSISAYLAPPIAAVYILAVLWPRLNESGAFWSLILSFGVGVSRMVLDVIYREPECGEPDYRPVIIKNVHYMYFAMILFGIALLTAVVISLITEPPEEFRLIRTTYWTRYDDADREDEKENLELKTKSSSASTVVSTSALGSSTGESNELKQESKLKRFFFWFCGLDDTDVESEDHVDYVLTDGKENVKGDLVDGEKGEEPSKLPNNNNIQDNNKTIQDFVTQKVEMKRMSRASILSYDDEEDEEDDEGCIGFEKPVITEKPLKTISSLRQSTKEKVLLRTFLTLVIILGISLYTYFSLPLRWRYDLRPQ